MFGWILLAWVAGAVPHPILVAFPKRNTGIYLPAIHVIAIVMVCSLVLPLLARRPKHEPEKPLLSMPGHEAAA
jgi:hypothetical protein